MKKTRLHIQLGRKLLAAAALAILSGSTAFAQLSVGDSGSGTLDFSTAPTVVGGWSTASFGTAAGTYTTASALDTAAMNLNASQITTALPSSTTVPPSANALARWNNNATTGFYLQTRPTGIDYLALLLTAQNTGTQPRTTVILTYDWAELGAGGGAVGEEIPGHRVFYSLTGTAGSWTLIPGLSTFTTTSPAQQLSAAIDLSATPWNVGSLLYIMWVDDNASGGTGTGTGQEGSYKIDNLSLNFNLTPPAIVTQPASQTNAEYSVTTLSVVASGSGPFTYAWKKNGTTIPGATGPAVTLTNTTGSGFTWSRPQDSGDYTVTVTGVANPPAVSNPAHVVIRPDTNAPTLLWAIAGTNAAGASIIRIALSEPLANLQQDYIDNFYWNVHGVGPGGDIGYADSVVLALTTNVPNPVTTTLEIQLEFNTPFTIDPNTTYHIDFENTATLIDRAQTPNTMASTTVSMHAHVAPLLSLDDPWKYSDLDLPAPAGWQNAGFDDSDTSFWKTGAGVFDGKRGATPCRATTLYGLGNVGTCIV